MKMIKKAKKGFTLIELVVVIAVIAILSGVSVVAYVGITNNARKKACDSEAAQLRTLIVAEDIDNENIVIEGNKITFVGDYTWAKLIEDMEKDADTSKDLGALKEHASLSDDGKKIVYTLDKQTTDVFEVSTVAE